MKAIVLEVFGGPDVFRIKEVRRPIPQKNEVLIKVKAIGINPVDAKVRAGTNRVSKMITLPTVIGWDVSGLVEELGPEVTHLKKGAEVMGSIGFPGAGGAYSEYVIADSRDLTIKPAGISFEEAAALPIAGLTAYQAIYEWLEVKSEDRLLIQAAAGGVGHLSVQFAKLLGAYVSGTASAKNLPFLEEIGVDRPIDYQKESFESVIPEQDAVQEAMGGEVLYRSISCVKPGGKVVGLPSSTKNDPKAVQLAKEKNVILSWGMMRADPEQLQTIAQLVADKKVKVNIDTVYDLEEMSRAHEKIETHHVVGKVVVRVS